VQQDQVEQPVAGSRTHPARAKTHKLSTNIEQEFKERKGRNPQKMRKTYKFIHRETPHKFLRAQNYKTPHKFLHV
jgi:hypothetical protein